MPSRKSPSPKSATASLLGEVLEWCAKAGTNGWFPSEMASAELSRESLYDSTLDLMRMGLIEAVAWERGRGQGYALTELGRSKLGTPSPSLNVTPPSSTPSLALSESPPAPAIPQVSTSPQGNGELTTYERGENARKAFAVFEPGRVSMALLVLMCGWFVYGLYWASRSGSSLAYIETGGTETLMKIGSVTGPNVYAGEWWRLVSCNFVHIGLIHLLVNGYSLYLAGSFAEGLWGSRKFLVIFCLSAVGGSSLAIALKPISCLAGASAGIWGVLSSIIVWMVFHHQHLPPSWTRNFIRQTALIMAINVGVSMIPGISWQGHLGGAAIGFLSSCLLQFVRIGSRRSTLIAVAIMVAGISLCVWSFRKFAETSSCWEQIRIAHQLLQHRSDTNELRQRAMDANRLTNRITFGRIANLHSIGALAMSSGNKAQLEQTTHLARSLFDEASQAATFLDSIAELSQTNSPKDAAVIRTQSQFFQRIAAFAESVESCTSTRPPDSKRWLTLHEELKQIEVEFNALANGNRSTNPTP